jgi:uncharacterized membrane protein YgcG
MKRLLISLGILAVLVAVLCIPALGLSFPSEEQNEPTRITSYDADFSIDEGGDMDVVETLTVDFPVSGRHGIFRFFDRVDTSAPETRRIVEDLEVTMDGSSVPVEMSVEEGRYDVARIGDPERTVSVGEHVYELSYSVPTVLTPGGEDVSTESQFYWQLIPSGWAQDIDHAELTVELPAAAEDVTCIVGNESVGEGDCQQVTGEGTRTVTVVQDDLDDHTPVTVGIGQDVATPEPAVTRAWAPRWDPVLGPGWWALGIVVLLALGAAVLGVLLANHTIERKPRFPLQYGPPEGVGPAQGSYIFNERINRQDYVATLMHAAEHGAIDLEPRGESWVIRDKDGPEGWQGLDEVTFGVGDLLPGPHGSFTADPDSVEAGRRLQRELEGFKADTKGWAARERLLVPAGLGSAGMFVIALCTVVTVVLALWNPLTMSMLGLPLAAFVAAGWPIALPGAGTKRTQRGRDLWSRLGGFHRVLSTPASQDRFDFSGREELYTAYIPWAVAFDCADAWAEKFRMETGHEPPAPVYFAGGYAAGYRSPVDSMVHSFESTLSGAISSYEATQRSSSSGGGGFSGGGGGGGGGGGSW